MYDYTSANSILDQIGEQMTVSRIFGLDPVRIGLGWLDYECLIAAARTSLKVEKKGPQLYIDEIPVTAELCKTGVYVYCSKPPK